MSEQKLKEAKHRTDEEYDSDVDENYANDFLGDDAWNHFNEDVKRDVNVSYINLFSEKRTYFHDVPDTADEYDSDVDESYGDLRIGDENSNYFGKELDHNIEKRIVSNGGKNSEVVDCNMYSGAKSFSHLETKREDLSKTGSDTPQETMKSVSNQVDLCPDYCSKIQKTVEESEEQDEITHDECYSDTSDGTTDDTEDENSDCDKKEYTFSDFDVKSDRYIVVIEKKPPPPSLDTKVSETCNNDTKEPRDDCSEEDNKVSKGDDKQETKNIREEAEETEAILEENTDSDLQLISLFIHTINDICEIEEHNLSYDAVENAIEEMTNSFRGVSRGTIQTLVNFDDVNYCVGYLWRFAPCHAVMVHDAISRVLESIPRELSDKLSPNQNLNLVSLGSGPGNDVVGLLSVLQSRCMKLQSLDLTLMDKMSGWQHVFDSTVRVLETKSLGNLSLMFQKGPRIKTSYIVEDLDCDFWSVDLISKLKRADVILLVKVLSHVPDAHKLRILMNIENCMKPGTLLIYIDCPFPQMTFDDLPTLRSIYKTEIDTFKIGYVLKNFGHKNIAACKAETHIFVKS